MTKKDKALRYYLQQPGNNHLPVPDEDLQKAFDAVRAAKAGQPYDLEIVNRYRLHLMLPGMSGPFRGNQWVTH
jgi:hypothetical protein